VRLDLSAPGIKEMGVRLTSPSGTTVTLFQPKTPLDIDPAGVIYLATSALYGESTDGVWTLRLFDHENDGLNITLNAWAIKFFYH
jgi:subtilisin-like proprotein convertase family protein